MIYNLFDNESWFLTTWFTDQNINFFIYYHDSFKPHFCHSLQASSFLNSAKVN